MLLQQKHLVSINRMLKIHENTHFLSHSHVGIHLCIFFKETFQSRQCAQLA